MAELGEGAKLVIFVDGQHLKDATAGSRKADGKVTPIETLEGLIGFIDGAAGVTIEI